ncbi:hypothetical protein [Nocardia amamiensis]|uniref:hypothetical protein n=1 Tax=Nocardia amamiensis TaxID=404578 RepID=UPI00082C0969|nr:hypothetical protein [Nocardia amamiensis]
MRGRDRDWLESMYGVRVPAAAAQHGEELGRWVRGLEERGGYGAEWTALVFPGQRPSSRGSAGLLSDQAVGTGEFDVGR